MGKVLCFGELLLRICPDMDGAWLKQNQLPFYVGGAELNVATALALWGVPSSYFTALPNNAMADQVLDHVQQRNIDTTPIQHSGERIGIYYLPKGKDLKNAGVIYDRAHSSFATLQPESIDWEKVLEGVSWFHFSAICPALNQAAAAICLEAVKAASARNIPISIDLNYRAKLWQYGKQPVNVMPELVRYATLVMGNIWAAEKMLGIALPLGSDTLQDKTLCLEHAQKTSEEIIKNYPNCSTVANTFRFDKGEGICYYTAVYTQNKLVVSKEYTAAHIVDKVGSGDCYMAGLIYGFHHQHSPQQLVDFATAAAFDKLFIPSDCTTSSLAHIQKIAHEN
jgi:2-dehydro-3-deoxygluconokinase